MTSKIEFLLKYCLICFMLTACGKEGEIPDALKEILDRNGYQDISNSNGGGGSGGGGTVRYTGSYDQNVRSLLSKVSGWQTPSSLNASDAVAPNVPVGTNCIRDTYVAAAVNFAWAAESYYRLGETARAAEMAANMQTQLNNARSLCSNAPGIGGGDCRTFSIYPC